MNKIQKEEIVGQIKDLMNESNAIYLVDYRGVNVEDINMLRKDFRKEGITYKVFKNNLVKRAIDELGSYSDFKDRLVGMIGISFSKDNFVAPAKIIKKYSKDKEKFNFQGCYIENDFFDESKLDLIAAMPSREEVISNIISSIGSPASGIVGTISAVMRDLVSLVDEISKKKAA